MMESVGDGFTDYQQARIHALEAALRDAVTLVGYLSDGTADEATREHARWFVAQYRTLGRTRE